jgi:hypothetical protein
VVELIGLLSAPADDQWLFRSSQSKLSLPTQKLNIGTRYGLNRLRSNECCLLGQNPMKCWTAVVCVATLAGCAGPRISVTDASARRIGFLVQNAWMVPMHDVDEQAASHCGQHGLSSRQTDAAWIGPRLKRIAYECGCMERPLTRKLELRRTPVRAANSATAKRASEDPKAAAWTKARAATDIWALCLRTDAERRANDTTEASRSVAQEVVDACSGLEHAVHEPLEAVGEDSLRFRVDLHAQAVQNASDTVTSVRIKTDLPISGPVAFAPLFPRATGP